MSTIQKLTLDTRPLPKGFSSREEYETYARTLLEKATELIMLANNNPSAVVKACKEIEAFCRRKADKQTFIKIRKQPNPALFLMSMENTLIPILEKVFAHEE